MCKVTVTLHYIVAACHHHVSQVLSCRAGLRTLMATGDYHHTALAIARGVGMVPSEGRVIIIQSAEEIRPNSTQLEPLQAKIPAAQPSAEQQSQPMLTRPSAVKPAQIDQQLAPLISCPAIQQSSFADKSGESKGEKHQRQMPDPSLHLVEGLLSNTVMESIEQMTKNTFEDPGKQSCSRLSLYRRQHVVSSNEHQGLAFHVDNSSATQDDALQALTAIAQFSVTATPYLPSKTQQVCCV